MVVGLTPIFITLALFSPSWGFAQTRAVKAKSPQYLLTYSQLKSLSKKARNQYLNEVAKALARLEQKPKPKSAFYFFQLIDEAAASGRFRCIGGGIPVPAGATTCGVSEYAGFQCASGEICNPLIFGVKADGTPICHRTASTAWCYKNTRVGVNTSLDVVYEKIGADEWNKLRSDLTAVCQEPSQTSEPDYVVRDACQHIEYQTQVNVRRGQMNEGQSLPKAAGNVTSGTGSAGTGADERKDVQSGSDARSAIAPTTTPPPPTSLLPRDVDWAMEGNRFEKGNVVELAPGQLGGLSVTDPRNTVRCQLPPGTQGVVTVVSSHTDGSVAPPTTYGIRFPQRLLDQHCPGYQTKNGELYYTDMPSLSKISVMRPRTPPSAETLALRNPKPASPAASDTGASATTGESVTVAEGASSAAAPLASTLAPATSPRPRARPVRPTPESAEIADAATAAIGLTPSSVTSPLDTKPGTSDLPIGSVVELAVPRGKAPVYTIDYQGHPAVRCDFNTYPERSRAQGILVDRKQAPIEGRVMSVSIIEFSREDFNRYCTTIDANKAEAALSQYFSQATGGVFRLAVPEDFSGLPTPFGKAVSRINGELQAVADKNGVAIPESLRYQAPTGMYLPDGSEITMSTLPRASSPEMGRPNAEEGASYAISEEADPASGGADDLRISSEGSGDLTSTPVMAPPPVVVDPGPAAEGKELADVIERVQTEAERGPDFDKELCEWLEGTNPAKSAPIGYRVTDADRQWVTSRDGRRVQIERCRTDKNRLLSSGIVGRAPRLDPAIMEKIARSGVNPQAFKNAMAYYQENRSVIRNQRYITIVDFSKSSREKRFFLIDLITGDVTKHYTTNGRNDTEQDGFANYFCNNIGSNSTPSGFHLTGGFYEGKHGRSMMLHGQEVGVNDNTCVRSVVVHPESADKVPGDNARQGGVWRSNGCPVLSGSVYNDVVDKIANGSLFYNYAGENVEPNKCE